MRADNRTRVFDKIKKNEELAKTFHEVYRKTFVAPDWDNCSWEFRQAVTAGVGAVVEEINRELEFSEKKNQDEVLSRSLKSLSELASKSEE